MCHQSWCAETLPEWSYIRHERLYFNCIDREVSKKFINYKKGIITINPINIVSGKLKDGQSIIELSACPKSNDVIGLQDLYLQLDISKSTFDTVVDEIASGLDPAASNYVVTSSYHNGNLVRS